MSDIISEETVLVDGKRVYRNVSRMGIDGGFIYNTLTISDLGCQSSSCFVPNTKTPMTFKTVQASDLPDMRNKDA